MKTVKTKTKPSRGGRPSREQAEQIEGRILDAARDLFFAHGYGVTSIEVIAKQARISKRTFYDRFKDKGDVFRAVVHRLVQDLHPRDSAALFEGETLTVVLHKLAQAMMHAALLPQGLAMQRIVLAEAMRFPELAIAVNEQGARRNAVKLITAMLDREVREKRMDIKDTGFAAEQFIQMVVSLPQRRAMGLGQPMTVAEQKNWARDSVELFLNGCKMPARIIS
jgi:AcrR family transcriptional regulator